MRICSPQLGISPYAVLGGEVFDRELLTHLAARGVAVHVILPKNLPAPECERLEIEWLPLRRGLRWYVSNPIMAAYLRRAYARQPYDLIRVHSLRFTGHAAVWARSIAQLPVPIVAHHHHVDHDRWTALVDSAAARRCDCVITGSRFAKEQLIHASGISPDRVEVVYYGVTSKFRPEQRNLLCQKLGLEGKRIVLYLGSLIERKNLDVLLRAFQLLVQAKPGLALIIAGEGPSRASLERQAEHLGIAPLVHFPGHIPEDEKTSWYNLADVFVLPSRLEGFGLVVAEAMACAKPVVASRAGALPEVVAEGQSGLLCAPHDATAFAQAIARILDDPALARSMAQAALERANTLFRWDRCAEAVEQIYAAAISRYHDRHPRQ